MQPLILCAKQRSGTHLFSEILGSAPDVQHVGEIFNLSGQYDDANFFTYKRARVLDDVDLAIPTNRNQRLLLEGFLESVSDLYDARVGVIDVKYNSWHHLDPVWHVGIDPPNLLSYLLEHRWPIVQITRRNKLEQYVSQMVAEARNVWHQYDGAPSVELPRVTIDIARCRTLITRSLEEDELFRSWLHPCERRLEIAYEDLLEDGVFSPTLHARCEALLDAELAIDPTPKMRKIVPSLVDVIENFDEVATAFPEWLSPEQNHGGIGQ